MHEPTSHDEWITAAEAARRWNLNDSTIRHAIRRGRIPPEECRKSGGTWLIRTSTMERLFGKPGR